MPRRHEYHDLESYFRALDAWMDEQFSIPHGALDFGLGPPFGGGVRDRLRHHLDDFGALEDFVDIAPGTSFSTMVSLTWKGERLTWKSSNQRCELTVTTPDGDKKSYQASNLAEFQKNYSKVHEKYKPSGIFETKMSWTVREPIRLGRRPLRSVAPEKSVPLGIERLLGIEVIRPPARRVIPTPRTLAPRGLEVTRVIADRLGARLGLRVGDVLLFADKKALVAVGDLQQAYDATKAGAELVLRVRRGAETIDIRVTKPKKI